VDGFEDSTSSNVSPDFTMISWVGSVGSGNVLGVSSIGGKVAVGVEVAVDVVVTQPASKNITSSKKYILFIVISGNKYT
jgi:hypothetical protein